MKSGKENLKRMSKDELRKRLAELHEKARALKWKAEGAKPKDVKEGRNLRKGIARVLTELNHHEK